MRIAFVAALASIVQATRLQNLPEPYALSEVDIETEAELQADVDAKLEAFVENLCESFIANNAEAISAAATEGKKPMDVETLKNEVVKHLKNFAADSELSMSGIMKAVTDVAATITKVGAAWAAPSPVTIALAAKQLWDDYQHAKGAFQTWKKNRDKRLGRK